MVVVVVVVFLSQINFLRNYKIVSVLGHRMRNFVCYYCQEGADIFQVATIEINEFTNRIHVQLIKTYSYTDSNVKQSRHYCSILHYSS